MIVLFNCFLKELKIKLFVCIRILFETIVKSLQEPTRPRFNEQRSTTYLVSFYVKLQFRLRKINIGRILSIQKGCRQRDYVNKSYIKSFSTLRKDGAVTILEHEIAIDIVNYCFMYTCNKYIICTRVHRML